MPKETKQEIPVENLQEQVRKHIASHDLFDWNEALTDNEITYLENLLLTFAPIFPPGSIGFDESVKPFLEEKERRIKELEAKIIKLRFKNLEQPSDIKTAEEKYVGNSLDILEGKIAEILRDNITFSPQINNYIIHGAIEKIISLFKSVSLPDEAVELKEENKRLKMLLESLPQLKSMETVDMLDWMAINKYREVGYDKEQKRSQFAKFQGNVCCSDYYSKEELYNLFKQNK